MEWTVAAFTITFVVLMLLDARDRRKWLAAWAKFTATQTRPVTLIYEKLHPDAKPPTKAYPGDAGWDLYAVEAFEIKPGSIYRISTGLTLKLDTDEPHYLRLADRSGLAGRGFHILGGVGDAPYRGDYKIIAVNLGSEVIAFSSGAKVAQVIPERIVKVDKTVSGKVAYSLRGSAGFGSSG